MTEENSDSNGYKLNRTGLIYDPLMLDFYCEYDDSYPEKPDRIKKPFERCEFYGLTEKCVRIEGRLSTDEEVEKCHTARVNKMMKETANMTSEELKNLSNVHDSTFFHQKSDKAARFALGSSIKLMDEIMTGNIDNGFAIIRPPGHHAMHDEPNGYCYFNNAAVVAKLALEKYNLERVLIIDWDVHHGQGTQFSFYNDPRVLYFSLHRYDFGNFWPNLRESDFDYIGEKEGTGYNINIPLNKVGFGNSEYAASFFNLLYPITYEFNPQLMIVSCGFDSAIGDEKGRMKVTPAAYAHFINQLSCFAGSKVCVLLEGGYCIKSLSEGVAMSVRSLLGYPCPRIETFEKPDPMALLQGFTVKELDELRFVEIILNLISVLRPYWKCLQGLNGEDRSQTLSEYLAKWDKTYRQEIKFFDLYNKPETYPLTGFYPLWTDDETVQLDKIIDKIIESTDLFVPGCKLCHRERESIEWVVRNVAERKFSCGLKTLESKNSLLDALKSAPNIALDKFDRIKKVLNVALTSHDLSQQINEFNESVLSIVLGGSSDVSKFRLNMKLEDQAGYLTCLLKIILPISYHFNPDLVFLFIDSNFIDNTSSVILLEQYVRMLSCLANGNLIVFIQNDSGVDKSTFDLVLKRLESVLNGNACTVVPKLVANEQDRKSIFDTMEKLKSDWDCFKFNEKLPAN